MQKSLIFMPSKEIGKMPDLDNLHEISIKTEDNVLLNGWFLDNNGSKTVIYFHGNRGNIYSSAKRLPIFNDLNLNVVLFDYRGYGKSQGKIRKEKDIYKDSEAVYRYVKDKGIKDEDIIIWGHSLGGAVAINLSQYKHIYATIIESTFRSMDVMAKRQFSYLPTSLILRFHFNNYEKITNITSPLMVIHSRKDEIIDISDGKSLFEKAKVRKAFIETQGSHNGGFLASYDLYASGLKGFLMLD